MPDQLLPLLPVVLPMVSALFGLVLATPSHGRRILLALAAALQVWVAWQAWDAAGDATLVHRLGGWLSHLGIVLVVDRLSSLMLLFCSFTAFACILFGYAERNTAHEHPLRVPLIFLLMAGVNLSLVTGDLFNLFVAFEVMLLASYALLTLESDAREVPVAVPYVGINLLGSTVFLATAGLCYGWLGTLNFADLVARMDAHPGDPRLVILGGLLLLVFATKAGIFPLMYWLPRAYPVLPAALAALFGGLLTKVGVYVLLRVTGTVLPPGLPLLPEALLWLGSVTMILGGLGALAQYRIQAILTWHIVSQIGFMVVALSLGSVEGFAAALAITLHNVLVKSSLLLCGGNVAEVSGTDDVRRAGGLWIATPVLGVFFLLQALSLAGIPPLSGFWGKLLLFRDLVGSDQWVVVFLAAFGSVLTLASMLKIFLGAFWKGDGNAPRPTGATGRLTAVIALLVIGSLLAGPFGAWFVRECRSAAAQALDRAGYRSAVMSANEVIMEGKQ